MRVIKITGLLVFVLITCFSCSKTDWGKTEQVFRYNESNGISGLDPAYARTQSLIWPVYQLFNGLVEMDDQLTIKPSIARSWEISEDGKTYTFRLRKDVFFHDHAAFEDGKGRKVNATDFVWSFKRILDPGLRSPGRWVFSYVEQEGGFFAPNDSVLIIRLKEAFAPFLGILTMPYCFVVPREVTEYPGIDFNREPVGTGPFRFHSWRDEEKLVFRRNPVYFEKDSNGKRLPYLDAVSISFIKDKQSEFMEFLLGNLDYLSGMHASYKDELITRTGNLSPKYRNRFKIIKSDYLNTEYLAFLCDSGIDRIKNSPFSNRDVRKAVNYGFDRVRMMKYLRNNIGVPAEYGMVPGGMKGYNPSFIKAYSYRPDSAALLLERAGFPGGEGLGELVLTTTADYLDICEFIQFELQKTGIKLRIEVATGATFRNKVMNSNLDFFRASWIADYPDPESYLSLFYSGNFSPRGPNYTHFSNKEYDSLYLLSNRITNMEEREKILYRMDQMVMDESVCIPLFYDQVLRIIPTGLEGFDPNPMNIPKLKYVYKK